MISINEKDIYSEIWVYSTILKKKKNHNYIFSLKNLLHFINRWYEAQRPVAAPIFHHRPEGLLLCSGYHSSLITIKILLYRVIDKK